MEEKLKEGEKEFLLNKYLSQGLSEKKAEIRLRYTIKTMVISSFSMIPFVTT